MIPLYCRKLSAPVRQLLLHAPFFSKSKTDKCFSCVSLFSHSIPCCNIIFASRSKYIPKINEKNFHTKVLTSTCHFRANRHKAIPETPILSVFPGFYPLLELSVSLATLNCFCLSFMQIHASFYFNYIIYYGLLIFCCQNVAKLTVNPIYNDTAQH